MHAKATQPCPASLSRSAHRLAAAVVPRQTHPLACGSFCTDWRCLCCTSCTAGDKTFTNHTTGTATRLGPWGYSYTPAGQVHSAEYHADTVFHIGFDGGLLSHWLASAATQLMHSIAKLFVRQSRDRSLKTSKWETATCRCAANLHVVCSVAGMSCKHVQ